MYGDSIFESLLGKQMGQSNADWADIADVWSKHHGSSKSMVLAISGMRVRHLSCPEVPALLQKAQCSYSII